MKIWELIFYSLFRAMPRAILIGGCFLENMDNTEFHQQSLAISSTSLLEPLSSWWLVLFLRFFFHTYTIYAKWTRRKQYLNSVHLQSVMIPWRRRRKNTNSFQGDTKSENKSSRQSGQTNCMEMSRRLGIIHILTEKKTLIRVAVTWPSKKRKNRSKLHEFSLFYLSIRLQ